MIENGTRLEISVLWATAYRTRTIQVDATSIRATFERGDLWDLAVVVDSNAITMEAWPTRRFGPAHAEPLYVGVPVQTAAMTVPALKNTAARNDNRRIFGCQALPFVYDHDTGLNAGLRRLNQYDGGNTWRFMVEDPNGLLITVAYTIEARSMG